MIFERVGRRADGHSMHLQPQRGDDRGAFVLSWAQEAQKTGDQTHILQATQTIPRRGSRHALQSSMRQRGDVFAFRPSGASGCCFAKRP
jgi:hypothetical protein